MDKFFFNKETLESLASKAGSSKELEGQSDHSMDPIDRNELQDRTLKFDRDHLTWMTEDMQYFNCVRFHSSDAIDEKDVIEDRRSL
jgi:hypothetical protein